MGRSYLKGTLEKIGIGYDEFRFFKYKSAMESFSRENMSEADREQRQALVDDMYAVAKKDISEGRGMSGERFDALVDTRIVLTAEDALKEGLVDTLARWTAIDDVLKNYLGEKKSYTGKGTLEGDMIPYATWSEPPQIAVIYALGACAMDDGIRARDLEKSVTAAVKNSKVKAIVLRVDSPGGDAMASDYVSEVLKGAKGKKPVIISQADVAASGGYWLSMYSDAIVAAPNTITGSIGVIGGWLYDKGFKASIGGSTDVVKAGKYADLGFGFTLPLIGLTIPDKPMTETERGMMETMIRGYYKDFVTKVAEGRGKQFDEIEKVAQGRVWSGLDGKEIGLVDHIGGIELAIALAKEKAGIAKEKEITVKEYIVQPYFNIGDLLSMVKGVKETVEEDPSVQQFKFRLEHNGRPLPMLPLDDMEIISR
jgi:protease-4